MPQNLAEVDFRGVKEAESSHTEEGEREKELHRVDIDSSLVLVDRKCPDHGAAGLKGSEDDRGEEVGERETQHSSAFQPGGFASGVSSAGMCPPTDVAESQLKPLGWTESITGSVFTEQDSQEWPSEGISPLFLKDDQSNTCEKDGSDLNQISVETSSPGQSLENRLTAETRTNDSEVFSSSSQVSTTSLLISSGQQATAIQQLEPESCSTENKATEIQDSGQSLNSNIHSKSCMHARDGSKGNVRVHFADSVKQDKGPSKMSATALGYCSLPPLTVHESLHHPVLEASFIFKDYLRFGQGSANTAPTEEAIPSSSEIQEAKPDDVINGGKEENQHSQSSASEPSAKGVSGVQLMDDTSSDQTETEKSLNFETTKHEEGLTTQEGEVALGRAMAKPEVQETGVVMCDTSVQQCNLSKPPGSLQNAAPLSPVSDVSAPERGASSQTETSSTTHPPSTELSSPSVLPKTANDAANRTADDSAASTDQPVSISKHSAGNNRLTLRPPGPMLSHREVISDCDIAVPEQGGRQSADCDRNLGIMATHKGFLTTEERYNTAAPVEIDYSPAEMMTSEKEGLGNEPLEVVPALRSDGLDHLFGAAKPSCPDGGERVFQNMSTKDDGTDASQLFSCYHEDRNGKDQVTKKQTSNYQKETDVSCAAEKGQADARESYECGEKDVEETGGSVPPHGGDTQGVESAVCSSASVEAESSNLCLEKTAALMVGGEENPQGHLGAEPSPPEKFSNESTPTSAEQQVSKLPDEESCFTTHSTDLETMEVKPIDDGIGQESITKNEGVPDCEMVTVSEIHPEVDEKSGRCVSDQDLKFLSASDGLQMSDLSPACQDQPEDFSNTAASVLSVSQEYETSEGEKVSTGSRDLHSRDPSRSSQLHGNTSNNPSGEAEGRQSYKTVCEDSERQDFNETLSAESSSFMEPPIKDPVIEGRTITAWNEEKANNLRADRSHVKTLNSDTRGNHRVGSLEEESEVTTLKAPENTNIDGSGEILESAGGTGSEVDGKLRALETTWCGPPPLSGKAEVSEELKSPDRQPVTSDSETRSLKDDALKSQWTGRTTRPLPSLESPKQEFLTPTEETVAPQRQDKITASVEATEVKTKALTLDLEKASVVSPEAIKTTEDLLKPKVELPVVTKASEEDLTRISKEPVQLPETVKGNEEVKEEQVEPGESKAEEEEPLVEIKEPVELQGEENLCEEPEEQKPALEETVEPAAEESAAIDLVQAPVEEFQDFGPSLSEHPPPAPLRSSEFPTPPSTPPPAILRELSAAPHHPDPACPPSPPAHLSDPPVHACESQQPLIRSSDSDGAFETPESTTPVKAASPSDTPPQQLPSEPKVPDPSGSDPASDRSTACRSPSICFDEDRPIAASGTYNFESFALESSHTLTRSLSLQGGELNDSDLVDGSKSGGFRPHSESFSVGTESAPGTLRRSKKVLTVKKKPLQRQVSNPERSRPNSASSTPEVKKRANLRQSSEEAEGGSATPSPGGTLRRTRKNRVVTPPPLPEETAHTSPEESLAPSSLPPCQEGSPPTDKEHSPIPPCASYKWDPDNINNIDPFKTGGSKIANSPDLARKGPLCPPTESFPVVEQHHSTPPPSPKKTTFNPEEQPILPKQQSVRLEFDYSEENSEASHPASPPPKKLGKKPGAKMPLRKPRLGLKKPPPAQTEQLDNHPPASLNGNEDEIPVPKASYNFDPDKWDDPNFNPFSNKKSISNSPKLSRASYTFDPNNFDDSVDPFKSTNKMANSPPKASASIELSSADGDAENDNDNVGELEDQNQNKPAKKKKTPIKSNTFRVKRSPKKTAMSDPTQDLLPTDDPSSLHPQDDHATDEEKLASSTGHKWNNLHDMDTGVNSDQQDYPHPSDLTSFVNEDSLPLQAPGQDYEIEYMEKIGSSSPPLSTKKPSLYLNLDSVSDTLAKNSCQLGSEPTSPCTGSFEEMEAQITAGMKSPILSCRPGPEGAPNEKGRKRESESLSRTQSTEREEQPPSPGSEEAPAPVPAMPLLDRLSECEDPVQYLEPDLAETNPTAFAQKLQQHRELSSPAESAVTKSSLYTRTTSSYIDGESPHLPRDLDHSLGIAREEIVSKEKEVLEWQRKYEDSRQEVVEMRRIVAEYEKTIAQMIEDDQKEKSLSHHTIQQLIMEKDQALADLNSVEKSLADLFRRYEKMKDVLEGFRKNEEVLKKCAQEYLSRVRKEEQRYQALKIHAEEKLDKANTEIAQVRAKSKQEQAAFQASLRKEQMKVDSLERTLEQKNKEIEELTKICDELIAKMGKS
ncbi:uncharacterized protein tacc2 isoform 4-T4 [Synchiropus picturatus]